MAFSLKDYTDIKKIGQGGMATVYTAIQTSLNRKVAIKKMAASLADNDVLIKRFENEAKSAASIEHDNIIKIYDFGMDEGAFHIAMEFVDGFDLEHLLKDRKFLKEVGLMIALQAMKGLAHAHKHGLVHRDVKPGNILVAKSGRVKVLDFGLAYAGESVHLTTTDAVLGTPLFMSPEQAMGEKDKDLRMDVFSAGVLLYRIITGKVPFAGSNVPSVLYAIIHTKEKDVAEIDPALPEDLAGNIRLCLEKDKDKRLKSLQPLIESLENYFYEMGVRDTAREIESYVSTQATGLRNILRKIISYHMDKGKQLSSSGEMLKSKAHLLEALRHDPGNREISEMLGKMDGIEATQASISPIQAQTGLTISDVSAIRKRPFRKKLFRAVSAGAVILLAAVATLVLSMDGKKAEVKVSKAPVKADVTIVLPKPDTATVIPQAPPKPAPVKKPMKGHVSRPSKPAKPTQPPLLAPAPVVVKEAGMGFLHVFSKPWAEFFIDGRRYGNTPTKIPIVLSEGRHQLLIKRTGFKDYTDTITVTKNDTVRIRVTLQP